MPSERPPWSVLWSAPWSAGSRSEARAGAPVRRVARGTTTTRRPAWCARQERSTSPPKLPKARSGPARRSNKGRSTSIPVAGTARTSDRRSYWPWSGSPTTGSGISRPLRVSCTPTERSAPGTVQSSSLGPAMPTDSEPRTASSSRASVIGAAALSEVSTHRCSVPWSGARDAAPASASATPTGVPGASVATSAAWTAAATELVAGTVTYVMVGIAVARSAWARTVSTALPSSPRSTTTIRSGRRA